MKQALSPTVDRIHNGQWERLECIVCQKRLHGPPDKAIQEADVSRFLDEHRLCGGIFREEKTPVS